MPLLVFLQCPFFAFSPEQVLLRTRDASERFSFIVKIESGNVKEFRPAMAYLFGRWAAPTCLPRRRRGL